MNFQKLINDLKDKKINVTDFKGYILEFYNKKFNTSFDLSKSSKIEKYEFEKYLNNCNSYFRAKQGNGYAEWCYHPIKESYNKYLYYTSLANKINILSQRHCYICDFGGSVSTKPFLIPCLSAQSKDNNLKNEIRNKFDEHCKKYNISLDKEGRFCISLTFVLGSGKIYYRKRDLDNMAKFVLDLFKGRVFGDDEQIDHLDLMKIIHPGKREHVVIRIQKTGINNHEDVFIKDDIDDIKFMTGGVMS